MSDTLTQEELELLDRIACAAVDPLPPPAAVRERLMESIRATPQLDQSVPSPDECVTVRADEGTWKTIASGARMKRLTKDTNRVVFLLDMEPNALVAAHDHDGGEDSYVIRGSCSIGGLGLAQGDFHHSDAGSHHGDVVASAEGCLLLITMAIAA
ncbi:MAG TPA: cupin domain-containing protein [Thermoanaerobaculia bacterium]|jgi:anti-sigma factor ChrR (cupin superfamily)